VTIHVLGLPHSSTTAAFEHCAYTSRTRDFATMLNRAGERVILYGGPSNDAEVAEFVPLATVDEQRAWFPGYEPRRDVFSSFDAALPGWQAFNARSAAAIRERAGSQDVLAVTMGTSHQPVAELVEDLGLLVVETGIGYSGTFAPFRVFESRAWRDFLAGRGGNDAMRAFDTVIPRAWDPYAFPAGAGGDDLLFVGRLIRGKGPDIAAEIARRTGRRLLVAGQGVRSWNKTLGIIECQDGTKLTGDVEYLGVLGPAERAQAMGAAGAVLVPTQYFEPLGGVSIEAQLTGTPAIVSDWGGLPANVVAGRTGFACNLLREYVAAVDLAAGLDRAGIREHAIATWSLEAIAPRFLEYFDRLRLLYGDGWYAAA